MPEDRRPTRAAIEAARRFNAVTQTYAASARDDRVVITVTPAVALRWGDRIGAVAEPDNPS